MDLLCVSCQSDQPFLRYGQYNVWPWKGTSEDLKNIFSENSYQHNRPVAQIPSHNGPGPKPTIYHCLPGTCTSVDISCTPLYKSNEPFFSGLDITELTLVLHKYKTPVTMCCILTCCWVNLVCARHLIVKIMPEKHAWGPVFLISDSTYIFQLFEN